MPAVSPIMGRNKALCPHCQNSQPLPARDQREWEHHSSGAFPPTAPLASRAVSRELGSQSAHHFRSRRLATLRLYRKPMVLFLLVGVWSED